MQDLYEIIESVDISGDAPQREPIRQYYYMKKCRDIISKRSQELGRKLTLSLQTMGCQMNARDSEKFEAILDFIGYETIDAKYADMVLINTCTIRENANLKVYGRLGYLKNYKKKNPHMKIAICGCMMQESHVIEKLKKSYPFVDMIFGTHNVYKLAEILYKNLVTNKSVIDILDGTNEIVEDLPEKRKYTFKAGVNIMFGCNNFCTYCVVPYVRGRERSRKHEDIIKDIENLAAQGVKEVMLLGQNVNSYGNTIENEVSFAKLLKMVNDVDGIERIRFMTSHPKDLSDELIQVMKECKKVCKHIHLPLQSGSSAVLKRMNRVYNKESYLELAGKIREQLPDFSITTDIIVGFPGETDEDFEDTLDVVEKVRYDSVFSFIYSKRSNTPAAKMPDQVSEDVVKVRFNKLLDLVHKISAENSEKLVGETVDVLWEEVNEKDESLITGRLSNNMIVHAKATPDIIGTISNCKITESMGFYYMGELA